MAGYIGPIPVPQATQSRETFTATASQTSFGTAGYQVGYLDVFMNGVKLAPTDFTATNGSDVVLASGAAVNDIIEVVSYSAFEVLNQNFTGTTTVADLTVTGDLTVDGTTTTINSTTLNVDDINITVASGAADAAAANGAGLTVDGANATFNYASSGDKWTMNKPLDVGGNLDVTGTLSSDGLTVDGDANLSGTAVNFDLDETDTTDLNTRFRQSAGQLFLQTANDAKSVGYNRLNINHSTGDISFYDTSGNAKFFWDASAESLTLNSTLKVEGGTTNGFVQASGSLFQLGASTASDLVVYTNNAERMRIESSGAVVINNTGGDAQLYFGGTSGTNRMYLARSGADSFLWNVSSGNMRFGTADAERMRIDSSGNLLVGETSPISNGDITLARSATDANISLLSRSTTDSHSCSIQMQKSSTNSGNFAATSSGDQLGSIVFRGVNTSAVSKEGASISVTQTGTDASTVPAAMVFDTNGTERMRIDSNGSILFNTSTLSDGGNNSMSYSNTGDETLIISSAGTGSSYMIRFMNGNGVAGQILSGGTTTSYQTNSDYRLKTDVQPMTGASDRVLALKPVNFEWIVDGTRTDGFLAHEAQEIVPEAIFGSKDAMKDKEYEVSPAVLDDDGNVVTEAAMGTRSVPDYQGIDQSKLVPLLTAALQEALTKIDALETRITALEG